MDSLISRLQRPGYDLQKEQAIQEAIVVLQQLNAERDTMRAKIESLEKQEPVAEWLPLDSGEDTRRD